MSEFVYVKPVEGRLVPRYSTLNSSSTTYIGAVRDGKTLKWTDGAVVRIPRAEWTRYLKEYQRALDEQSLKLSNKAEFDSWETARDVVVEVPQEPAPATEQEAEPTPAPTPAEDEQSEGERE